MEATAVVPIFHLIELKRAFWLLFKWWWLGRGEVGWMTQRENFGAGDIIRCLISEGESHCCLKALQIDVLAPGLGANAKGQE